MSYLLDVKQDNVQYIVHYPSYSTIMHNLLGVILPGLAGPVTGRKLGSKVVTVMTGTEGLPPSWDVLLDAHLGVSKSNQPDLPVLLGKDSRFLRTSGGGFGFVVS